MASLESTGLETSSASQSGHISLERLRSRSISSTLKRLVKQYEAAIIRDPSIATKIEVLLKVSSYLIPSKLSSWKHLSEVAYAVSNLFSLFNDYLIINKTPRASFVSKLSFVHRHLLWSISVLEYLEVVAEVSSEYLWREAGKWFIVLIMRLVKLVLQCIALLKYNSSIISSPAVPSIDRKKVKYVPPDILRPPEGKKVAYVGKRTGKIIRSIYADPAIPYSELQYYMNDNEGGGGEDSGGPTASISSTGDGDDVSTGLAANRRPEMMRIPSQPVETRRVIAELLHIARPLVHILCMVKYRETSWKPWLVSLIMDMLSLHLHDGLLKFTKREGSSEILRRRLVLLLYLLRSPFYDKFTKESLLSFMHTISQYVPLTHFIIDPLMEYLPIWQHIYSYNWMS